jgi:hypothetical protein
MYRWQRKLRVIANLIFRTTTTRRTRKQKFQVDDYVLVMGTPQERYVQADVFCRPEQCCRSSDVDVTVV